MLTFVHLYSRDEKELRDQEVNFCCPDLAQFGMELEDHPWSLCQWQQMWKEEAVGRGQVAQSSLESEAVSDGEEEDG